MPLSKRGFHCVSLVALLLTVGGWLPMQAVAEKSPQQVAVATVHPIASDAAAEVFREGGNAVDAAVAAALTLGVVDSHNSGIGGGCLILVRRPSGHFLAIDGREMAPAAATRDMYLRDGEARPDLSQSGPLASGTPGALAAYAMLLEECGSMPLARLIEAGREAADSGFQLSESVASALDRTRRKLAKYPASRRALLKPDGSAPMAGEIVTRPDLAETYRKIAQHGPDWFYRGEFAQRTGDWMANHGGILSTEDFASYEAKRREPVVTEYRGHTIVGFPPPSSGGVHVAQILNLIEPFDVGALYARNPADGAHLLAEAMKLAFADRAHWLGDSDYAEVPRGLIEKEYARRLGARISMDRATAVAGHGTPPQWRQDLFDRHTTHIATADSDGYWVAITATINTSFGSKVVIPGTGVVLNNEMDDFAIHPGTPNAFGLLGAENNSVAAGKRPLSAMSPTIVLDKQGEPTMTLGAAGGPKIITQVVLAIVGLIDRGLTPEEALSQARIHHQWRPNQLMVEPNYPEESIRALRAKGHDVDYLSSHGRSQLIARDDNGRFVAVYDPRINGKAVVDSTDPKQIKKRPEPAESGAE